MNLNHTCNWACLAIFFCSLLIRPGYGQVADTSDCKGNDSCLNESQPGNWVDSSRGYVVNKADSMAQWMDKFFGTGLADFDSASSHLRLQLVYDWDEEDANVRARLNGKLNLPQIDERLSLVFSEEDGDQTSVSENLDDGAPNAASGDNVGVQYNLQEKKNSRIDLMFGFRSGLKIKAGARYRYDFKFTDTLYGRFREELFFQDGKGLGTETRGELNKELSANDVLRYTAELKFGEKTGGIEWSNRASFNKRFKEGVALSYFVFANGETREQYLTKNVGLGVRFRRSIYRDWLFFELEPNYSWRREEPADNRDGVAGIITRLEIALER